MAGNSSRLRKYKRKKDAAAGNGPKWNRIAQLYWRYHLKVHGPTMHLWNLDKRQR